ncbi:poly A polymerase family protein [Staphylococcus aureus]|uniref:Poly A polymerase family protein n=1 Tax=Staphylococcus aureus TaxID=1280 RepID=A0A2X2JVI7_STAAU|nr:poly A polymerase family protein [Staphylococcus aureus]
MDKSLFEQARPILEQIQDNGFEAYYVGGSVRIMSWEEIFMI